MCGGKLEAVLSAKYGYRGTLFNCEYLLIANCERYPMFTINRFANKNVCVYYIRYGVDYRNYWIRNLTSTQLLNHAIKTSPTVPFAK